MLTRMSFRSGFVFSLAFCVLFAPDHAIAQRDGNPFDLFNPANQPTLTYSQTFEKVWKTTKDRFYDPEMNGANWNALHKQYAESVKAVKSKTEFADLMNRLLGELHVSHTDYYTDEDFGFYMFPSVLANSVTGNEAEHIGITGRKTEAGYLVTGVLEGSPAEKVGLLVGDVILSADGKPFTTVGSFRGKAGQSVTLQVRRKSSAPIAIPVTPVKENILGAFLNATNKSAKIIEMNGKRIGYIHLWTMGTDAFKSALQNAVMGKLYATDGLILDIRDGFGGRPFGYSDLFCVPAVKWQQNARGIKTERKSAYGKPMVLLINGGSRSAKEYFSYEMKKVGRATLVGTTTAGAFLGASGFPMSKTGFLEIPIVSLLLDGKRLEGKGVAPDVVVNTENPYTKEDSQLKKSEEVLLEKIRVAPPTGEREVVAP